MNAIAPGAVATDYQAELHAAIKHRVVSTGEPDATPIHARHALPVGDRPMVQVRFGGYVLRSLRELAARATLPTGSLSSQLVRSRRGGTYLQAVLWLQCAPEPG